MTGKTGPRSVPFGRRAKAAPKLDIEWERKASSPRIRKLFPTRSGQPLSVDAGCQQVSNIVRRAGAPVFGSKEPGRADTGCAVG